MSFNLSSHYHGYLITDPHVKFSVGHTLGSLIYEVNVRVGTLLTTIRYTKSKQEAENIINNFNKLFKKVGKKK